MEYLTYGSCSRKSTLILVRPRGQVLVDHQLPQRQDVERPGLEVLVIGEAELLVFQAGAPLRALDPD